MALNVAYPVSFHNSESRKHTEIMVSSQCKELFQNLDMTRGSVYSVSAYNRAVLIKQHNPPGQSATLQMNSLESERFIHLLNLHNSST